MPSPRQFAKINSCRGVRNGSTYSSVSSADGVSSGPGPCSFQATTTAKASFGATPPSALTSNGLSGFCQALTRSPVNNCRGSSVSNANRRRCPPRRFCRTVRAMLPTSRPMKIRGKETEPQDQRQQSTQGGASVKCPWPNFLAWPPARQRLTSAEVTDIRDRTRPNRQKNFAQRRGDAGSYGSPVRRKWYVLYRGFSVPASSQV
jgi:hypothetical protein